MVSTIVKLLLSFSLVFSVIAAPLAPRTYSILPFAQVDTNSDGVLSYAEVQKSAKYPYWPLAAEIMMQYLFNTYDVDRSNSLDRNEYNAMTANVITSQETPAGNAYQGFRQIDTNGDNMISKVEYRNFMARFGVDIATADSLFDLDDTDHDNMIPLVEWMALSSMK